MIDSLTLGGAEALTATFAKHADPRLLQLHVVCLRTIGGNVLEEQLKQHGISVTNLHARHLRDVRAFRRLCALLREWRAELIHAHLSYACIWGSFAGRCVKVPTVLSMHVAPLTGLALSRTALRQRLLVALARHWATQIIFVSEALQRAWQGRFAPAPSAVLYNGIDCEALGNSPPANLHELTGLPARMRIGITVSVLRDGKGLDVLLNVARQIADHSSDIAFVIVGDGALFQTLRRRIQRLELQHVVFLLGRRADVPALLAGADFFVFPSRYDAFPTAVLEAMAAGLPVIASNTGGIPEITAGGAGQLVPPGDVPALVSAIVKLMADDARRQALGRAGRARVRDHFSARPWARRLTALYRHSLDGRIVP